MVEAIIFDMDGVMVDTEALHSQAYEAILREYGVVAEKNPNGLVNIVGSTTADTWEIFKTRYGLDESTEVLTAKKQNMLMHLLGNNLVPLPGLRALLDDLRSRKVKLAVATSAQQDRAMLILKELGVLEFFEAVITANDITHGKPDPEIYVRTGEKLDVMPENCVVIEDAETGVKAAKGAHMKVVAVPNKYTSKMDFSSADLVVASLEELSSGTLLGF